MRRHFAFRFRGKILRKTNLLYRPRYEEGASSSQYCSISRPALLKNSRYLLSSLVFFFCLFSRKLVSIPAICATTRRNKRWRKYAMTRQEEFASASNVVKKYYRLRKHVYHFSLSRFLFPLYFHSLRFNCERERL